MLSPERQSVDWMSKITNDSLTQSGTGCFIAVHIWQLCISAAVKVVYISLAYWENDVIVSLCVACDVDDSRQCDADRSRCQRHCVTLALQWRHRQNSYEVW